MRLPQRLKAKVLLLEKIHKTLISSFGTNSATSQNSQKIALFVFTFRALYKQPFSEPICARIGETN